MIEYSRGVQFYPEDLLLSDLLSRKLIGPGWTADTRSCIVSAGIDWQRTTSSGVSLFNGSQYMLTILVGDIIFIGNIIPIKIIVRKYSKENLGGADTMSRDQPQHFLFAFLHLSKSHQLGNSHEEESICILRERLS